MSDNPSTETDAEFTYWYASKRGISPSFGVCYQEMSIDEAEEVAEELLGVVEYCRENDVLSEGGGEDDE